MQNSITFVFQLHTQIDTTANKLRGYLDLPEGWNRGEGVKVDSRAIATALYLLEVGASLGFLRSDAFPGLDGEATLVFYADGGALELRCWPDATVDMLHETDADEKELGNHLPIFDAEQHLRTFRAEGCSGLKSVISNIDMRQSWVGFGVRHSFPVDLESQSFQGSVLPIMALKFVNI